MPKPINVEAQRVAKIIEETQRKLKVLSYLNCEFFKELLKKDEEQVCQIYGPKIGPIMYQHA